MSVYGGMKMEIKGSVAIVTGGNGGMGWSICRALATQGASVVIGYQHSHEAAQAYASELSRGEIRSIAVQADVTREPDVQRMIDRVMNEFGRIDIFVNNAAYNVWVPFEDLNSLNLELWEKILAINTTGPFLCMKAVASIMVRQKRGRIVNIASIAGLMPSGSSIAYAVSKAALIHLTRCMAVALAPDVLVNSIAPGYMEGTRISTKLEPAHVERVRKSALIGRPVEKDDVAAQVLTFTRSDSTTGQTICIDGGRVFH